MSVYRVMGLQMGGRRGVDSVPVTKSRTEVRGPMSMSSLGTREWYIYCRAVVTASLLEGGRMT